MADAIVMLKSQQPPPGRQIEFCIPIANVDFYRFGYVDDHYASHAVTDVFIRGQEVRVWGDHREALRVALKQWHEQIP